MNEELKPCPLCDGKAEHYMSVHLHNVGCTKCPLKIKGFETKAEAITAWNTRPSPWILITPETLKKLKQEQRVIATNGEHWLPMQMWCGKLCFSGSHKFDAEVTHYQPITLPPIPEKGT